MLTLLQVMQGSHKEKHSCKASASICGMIRKNDHRRITSGEELDIINRKDVKVLCLLKLRMVFFSLLSQNL